MKDYEIPIPLDSRAWTHIAHALNTKHEYHEARACKLNGEARLEHLRTADYYKALRKHIESERSRIMVEFNEKQDIDTANDLVKTLRELDL